MNTINPEKVIYSILKYFVSLYTCYINLYMITNVNINVNLI